MLVKVRWSPIRSKTDPKWTWIRVLYAYLTPDQCGILYIGKAYKSSVRERWNFSAKEGFWQDLELGRKITKHIVIVGDILLPPGSNISEQLVSDVESLLIEQIKPWGNIQSTRTRISRPGLKVQCVGGWNGWSPEYRDAS
jgi:hypothetical protein